MSGASGDSGDDGFQVHAGDRGFHEGDVLLIPAFTAHGDIIAGHVTPHVAAVAQFDSGQPFDVGDPIPARNDESKRGAVAIFHGSAVAFVSQEQWQVHGIFQCHAASVGDFNFEFPVGAGSQDFFLGVFAVKNNLDGFWIEFTFFQERGKGSAAPFAVVDGVHEPFVRAVAGAFECHGLFFFRQSTDVIHGKSHGVADQSVDG